MISRTSQFTNRILNNIKKREQLLLPQQSLNLQETKKNAIPDYDMEDQPNIIDSHSKIEKLTKKKLIEKTKVLLLNYQL